MDGQYFLLADVAEMVDVHDTTLRKLRWRCPEVFRGSYYARCGNMPIYLYTDGDIDRISSYLAERSAAGCGKRGRPRMWSAAEAKERERAQLRTNYYRRRAEALPAKGDAARAKTYLDRREAVLDSLHAQSMLLMQELMAMRTIGDGRTPRPCSGWARIVRRAAQLLPPPACSRKNSTITATTSRATSAGSCPRPRGRVR
jgi:hypothetical protein